MLDASSAPDKAEVVALLHTYNDTLIFAEPLLFDLWQSFGLTIVQLRILRILKADGPKSAGRLAAETGLFASSLTRILDRLEEEHLLERAQDPVDKRQARIAITSIGLSRLGSHGLLRGTIFERAVEQMSQQERREVLNGLGTLSRYLRNVTQLNDSI